jgi:hypothetical protein
MSVPELPLFDVRAEYESEHKRYTQWNEGVHWLDLLDVVLDHFEEGVEHVVIRAGND